MSKYPNSGAVFVNKRKESNTDPDRTGSAEIDGVEYWVSGWINDGKEGKYLKLKFKRKEQKAETATPKEEKPFFDDPIAF